MTFYTCIECLILQAYDISDVFKYTNKQMLIG